MHRDFEYRKNRGRIKSIIGEVKLRRKTREGKLSSLEILIRDDRHVELVLGRVPGVLERRLLRLDEGRWTGTLVPRRVLLPVHARRHRAPVPQADVRHVRLPVHPLHLLAPEIPVTPRLALRIELATDRQIVLADDPLRPLVAGRRPRVALFGAAVQRGEAPSVAALARVAYVLAALRQVRDTLLLVGSRGRYRVKGFRGGSGSAASVENRVGHVGGRGRDYVLPVVAGLGGDQGCVRLRRLRSTHRLPELGAARLA